MSSNRREFLSNTFKLATCVGMATVSSSLVGCSSNKTSKASTEASKLSAEPAIFSSSDKMLADGYQWASNKALSFVNRGDPVGDWYEAALPNRQAFCMRDTSHQSTGASVLGLSDVNKNMLTKFVAGISESKDWCTFWEIDKHDRPAPVDYTNDQDFWYNLPANFDLIDCCWRQYLWTGDSDYLNHPVFINFYQRSVNEHVKAWDRTGNGIMDSAEDLSRRGIPSYDEALNNLQTASDQIIYQALGYNSFAKILETNGDFDQAQFLRNEATRLNNIYNQTWWNEEEGYTYGALTRDGKKNDIEYYYGLLLGAYNNTERLNLALTTLSQLQEPMVEYFSHYPEIFYRYSKVEQAYQYLLALTSADLHRRDYPEASFSAVGAYATGLMGISPDFRSRTVETRGQLSQKTDWAEMSKLTVLGNQITIKHSGNQQSQFTNTLGLPITWRAAFTGNFEKLVVDGKENKAKHYFTENHVRISYLDISLAQGQSAKVSVTLTS